MGVEKQVIRPGTGPRPSAGQNVTVHCTGFGKNRDLSQKFWRLAICGVEFVFLVCLFDCFISALRIQGKSLSRSKLAKGSVIKGWDEGVMGMQVGEVARLRCSPDYAYGAGGFPAWGIQPNSVLDFEIEVISVE
ncbi:hypothetical protein OIU77_002866 [Salix suchowensis]|uniref:peptidylprolyl isomerase n=1 Tax=Salix suchowensis TaxID=1278906 RepID=A0ABQ9AZY5_9ROSI|nr:hypothetical protein OIU77_002866 [Salix suchowensis]